MKIEANEQVLHDLGIKKSGITAEVVGNMALSEKNVGQQQN